MTADWSIIIEARKEYYIIKKDNKSIEYVFIRRGLIESTNDKIMEYFEAGSDEEAIYYGIFLARKYGLRS